ncbi:MAG: DUF11 domain-containing protein [Chloroflexota bacterium]|nr:DUF11 domain-containing protein [Chloroflexota bacterium]
MTAQTVSAVLAVVAILIMAAIGMLYYEGQRGRAQAVGGLAISMTDAPDPVAPGGSVVYTITVTNTGAAEEAGVEVEDVLAGPGTIQSATPSQGACAPPAPTAVTCSLGTLAPGATGIITVEKLAAPGVGGVTELLVGDTDSPVPAADGSGPSAGAVAAIAVAAIAGSVAAAFALAAGGWYARRRWLR